MILMCEYVYYEFGQQNEHLANNSCFFLKISKLLLYEKVRFLRKFPELECVNEMT